MSVDNWKRGLPPDVIAELETELYQGKVSGGWKRTYPEAPIEIGDVEIEATIVRGVTLGIDVHPYDDRFA